MKLIFQTMDGKLPTAGAYYFTDGKTEFPKGASLVKLVIEPGFVSNAGDILVVEYEKDKIWFTILTDQITVTNPKKKETKNLNFTFSVPKSKK